MKRILVVIGVVLGLGAIGLTAAHADNSGYSTWCTDSGGSSTDVPNGVVGLSYESYPNDLWVCYSTTPNGSGNPEAAGGIVHVGTSPAGDAVSTGCGGDRGTSQVVVVECQNHVALTDPSSAPGTTASASVQVGTVGPVTLGQTGVEVGAPTPPTPNEPGGGNGTGGTVSGGVVCTWANGVPFCPTGSAPTTVTVAEDDLMPIVETAPSCVYLDGDCLVPTVSGARVTLFPDSANDTIGITTGPEYDRTDVARTCIGVNYACP